MTPDEIRALRALYDMSQEAFAREVGVSLFTVNRWETGKTKRISPLALKSLLRLRKAKEE